MLTSEVEAVKKNKSKYDITGGPINSTSVGTKQPNKPYSQMIIYET